MAETTTALALAEFANPHDLLIACEKVRDAGYSDWDAHTPFPVHGLDRAMGLQPSKVAWICAASGFSGAIGAFLLQTWVSADASRLVISGKPYFSWQAFIPVTFEVGVLFATLGAVIGMFIINGLPKFYNPIFNSERFAKASDDGFFVSIQADDPNFDSTETLAFLRTLGATHAELVED